MAFTSILFGGLQVLILLSLTGVLVSLAILSRLVEFTFNILQPTVLFVLHQSVRLIVFWIILSLQQVSNVLRRICLAQPIDMSSGGSVEDSTLKIGITPVEVPYARHPYQRELLVDVDNKTSLPEVQEPIDEPVETN